MKSFLFACGLFTTFLVFRFDQSSAQDSTAMSFSSPFDSISLTEVKVVGQVETGVVDITVQVRNSYQKLAQLNFGSGSYSDFGILDDKGVRYALFHSERLETAAQANQGYSPISALQFGKDKRTILNLVHDTLAADGTKLLWIRLGKVNKTTRVIREAHLLCTLQLNYMVYGQKQFIIKNAPIDWVQTKKVSSVHGRS
ncbi:hypothetical protein ACQ86N_02555 [Puia sp. P3]|uniref:hypothetical protein n=1 Tax=Puia sp. P3 TaxID=3423952 RepID=UPI003D67745A